MPMQSSTFVSAHPFWLTVDSFKKGYQINNKRDQKFQQLIQNYDNELQFYQVSMTDHQIAAKQAQVPEEEVVFDPVEPIELIYQDISVLANTKVEKEIDGKKVEVDVQKQILKACSGKFQANTFTAIMGPSGCGKTTMLNLISGRQLSDNLELRGILRVNGQTISNISKFKSYVGYVMQEDYMLPTFTPFEAFKFVTDLRLSHLSEQEKIRIVESVIKSLGLQKCKDTWVGDTRIRGVSGGEKKRTSIGLQLLINPSIIFLDEPTTGLDSTTSLNLIRFLNKLSKQGRTVISTIHQPSSEIFMEFNKIILMVDGNIIYDGNADKSIKYFDRIGLGVPKHTNPTDHYMKLLNKEGIMLSYIQQKKEYTDDQVAKEFGERVDYLVSSYKKDTESMVLRRKSSISKQLRPIQEKFESGWWTQFSTIFIRNGLNQFRQPLDVLLKVFQAVFFGIMCIILYYEKGTTIQQILQNNQGVLFFLIMNTGFSYVFASVNLFNFQRPVFIRERLSNTYSTSAYYMGRTFAILPVEILTCFLFLVIAYFPCNLTNTASVFFQSLLAMELTAFMSSSFGLLLSTIFSDASVVMALVPVLIIPFLLVGGFFVPLETVHWIYYPFEYLSMFRYGFEAMVYSQYQGNPIVLNGVSFQPLGTNYNFAIDHWVDLLLMAVIGVAIRIVAFIVMYKISNPHVKPLLPPEPKQIHAQHHDLPEITINAKA